jgi:hypothetical protein|tara:strand:+ start:1614 stop:1844 length:231 start_codon:yes stop_codon:yes gene_type:complete
MPNDIEKLKQLAGVNDYRAPSNPQEAMENMSATATDIKQKERELGVKPGDPKWFDLWFGKSGAGNTQTGFRGRTKR